MLPTRPRSRSCPIPCSPGIGASPSWSATPAWRSAARSNKCRQRASTACPALISWGAVYIIRALRRADAAQIVNLSAFSASSPGLARSPTPPARSPSGAFPKPYDSNAGLTVVHPGGIRISADASARNNRLDAGGGRHKKDGFHRPVADSSRDCGRPHRPRHSPPGETRPGWPRRSPNGRGAAFVPGRLLADDRADHRL